MQLIALHIQGKRNWGADGLSRDGVEGDTVANVLDSAAGSWHGAPAAGAARGKGICFCCGCGAATVSKSREPKEETREAISRPTGLHSLGELGRRRRA